MEIWELYKGMLRKICFETLTRYWSYSGSNSLCRFWSVFLSSCFSVSSNFLYQKSLRQDVFERRTSAGSELFCILGQWFCLKCFVVNCLFKSKDISQFNFVSVKEYLKRKGLTSGWLALLKNAFAYTRNTPTGGTPAAPLWHSHWHVAGAGRLQDGAIDTLTNITVTVI